MAGHRMAKYITAEEAMFDCEVCELSCAERELIDRDGIMWCPRCKQTARISAALIDGQVLKGHKRDVVTSWRDNRDYVNYVMQDVRSYDAQIYNS